MRIDRESRRAVRGFTLIEVLAVVVIGSLLATVASTAIGPARDRVAVRSAQDTFASLEARARATAIERGTTTRFFVNPSTDVVWITLGTDTLDIVNFASSLQVDIQSGTGGWLCMSPRGYADTDCNSFAGPVTVSFVRGDATRTLTVLPMGQIVY